MVPCPPHDIDDIMNAFRMYCIPPNVTISNVIGSKFNTATKTKHVWTVVLDIPDPTILSATLRPILDRIKPRNTNLGKIGQMVFPDKTWLTVEYKLICNCPFPIIDKAVKVEESSVEESSVEAPALESYFKLLFT